MADVFISYAREDRQWVEKLAEQLQAEGFSVWWDWDLLVGKRYRETIDAELQACKAAVVVWSQYSVRSDFVRDEAEEAQQRNVLLPILKEVVRPPAGFRQIQSADLSNWNGGTTDDELRRVMKGVAHLVGHPAAGNKNDSSADSDTQQKPLSPATSTVRTAEAAAPKPESRPVVPAKTSVAALPINPWPVVRFKLPTLSVPRLPARTSPIWRYALIGAVAVIIIVYVVAKVASLSSNTVGKLAHGASPVHGGAQPEPASTALSAPPVGTATEKAGLSSDVATAIQKAEEADRSGRERAALAVQQRVLADAASARARQGEFSSVAMLTGRDGSGNTFTFAGETADGTEQGVGAAAISNGSHYSGEWFGGVAQGLGVFTYGNGDQYSGEFDENLESGLGAVTFVDKSKGLGYSGQWAANAYNGYGVYYFQNGTRLEGLWRAGQLSGLGARFDPAGKLIEQGTYQNSVLKR
jgi:hypothetical protein